MLARSRKRFVEAIDARPFVRKPVEFTERASDGRATWVAALTRPPL